MTKSDRKSLIAAAAVSKKGSLKERLDNATAPGPVKPSKPAPTKIPSALNLTKPKQEPLMEDAVVQDEGTMAQFVEKANAKRAAAAKAPAAAETVAPDKAADKELDASVAAIAAAKKKKPAKDPNLLSVSDIARELNIDPKRARARLRASGKAAADGRWPLVLRGSNEHANLAAIIKGDDAPKKEGAPGLASWGMTVVGE